MHYRLYVVVVTVTDVVVMVMPGSDSLVIPGGQILRNIRSLSLTLVKL